MAETEPSAEISEQSKSAGEEEIVEDVVVLLCTLNLEDSKVLGSRKIWRRLAVPADFSLLELHVTLQNGFDWEDTHLHDFSQPRRSAWPLLLKADSPEAALSSISIPQPGFGRTDLTGVSRLLVDLDVLPPGNVRTFKTVEDGKDSGGNAAAGSSEGLLLSLVPLAGGSNKVRGKAKGTVAGDAASEGEAPSGDGKAEKVGDGEEEESDGRGSDVVFVEHSHPHADVDTPAEEKKRGFATGPEEVLDERAFEIGDVLTKEDPLLVYQYDFGMSYEVYIVFEGRFQASEGVNYPTCIAGAGASPAEDGNDMDEDGELLASYVYSDFAVLDVLANFEKTFEDAWPVGPGAEESLDPPRCYMCRYNRECGRRRECTGKCCTYCLKHAMHLTAGTVPVAQADSVYDNGAQRLTTAREELLDGGKCGFVESDGTPCVMCQGEA